MTQKKNNSISIGDSVKFYDCHQAFLDKDYSGENPKHYPIGIVKKIYDYKSYFGYTDRVCDIQVGNRISEAHFISAVTPIN